MLFQAHLPSLPLCAASDKFMICKLKKKQLTDLFVMTHALNNLALIATIMVLKLMKTAPIAGLITIPQGAKTPAANGIAKMLYPVAHHKFWTIFR